MGSRYTRYLIFLSPLLFGGCLLIAYLLEPPNPSYPYYWVTSTISRLGWPGENVIGWIFFSLGFLCLGTLSFSLLPTYVRKFASLRKRWSRLLFLFLFLASMGEILIGAIPNFKTPDQIFMVFHLVDAMLYFLCAYGVGIMMGVVFAQKKNRQIASKGIAIMYAILLVYGLFATIAMIIFSPLGSLGYYTYVPGTPFLQSMPFWEWQSFFLALFLVLAPLYFQVNGAFEK